MDCLIYSNERISICSVTGRNHATKGIPCADVIYIKETPEIQFLGLADGQGQKTYCREGGKEVLHAMFRFIAGKGIARMIQYEYVDELQYELMKAIRDTISDLATTAGVDKAEYASTLVVFAYDTQSGNYVLLHLGDGGIICQKKDGTVHMLSSPENGLTSSYTWLTTSPEALHHLRIGFGNVKEYKRIMMITDGATIFARGKNIPGSAGNRIGYGSREEITSLLTESSPSDDASCIIIDGL